MGNWMILSKILGMGVCRVSVSWCLDFGFMCLDRIADLVFFWKPLPNECCQLASSSGFAVPTAGMMVEMLSGQFGDDATMIWAWVIQGICFCWRALCVCVP